MSAPKLTPEEEAEYRSTTSSTGPGKVHAKLTPEEEAEYKAPVPPKAAAPDGPSTGRAVAEGALQGGSYGFGDELQGVIGAVLRRSPGLGYPSSKEQGEENIFEPSGYGGGFMDDYRKERDAARADRTKAETAHPTAFSASQLAAAILAPGPKAGKSVGGFVKAGAKAGTAYGLGASDADLTKGDVGGAALDTALGTGFGGVGGLVGGLLNKGTQAGARKFTEMGQRAYQRGTELANKPIDSAINSASGALGGRVAAGRSTLSNLAEDAVNADLPEDLSRRASDLLSDDAAKALNERVARSTQGQFFQKLPAIEKAQTVLDEALERGNPEARMAAVEALMSKSPMKRAMWEISKRIGPTLVGASVGGSLGGTAAAGVGGTLGLLTGAMSGAPGRIVRNAVASPQFQRSAAQLGERATGEAIPGAIKGVIAEQAGNPQSSLRESLAPYLDLLEEKKK